jgi:hypothetical protein
MWNFSSKVRPFQGILIYSCQNFISFHPSTASDSVWLDNLYVTVSNGAHKNIRGSFLLFTVKRQKLVDYLTKRKLFLRIDIQFGELYVAVFE